MNMYIILQTKVPLVKEINFLIRNSTVVEGLGTILIKSPTSNYCRGSQVIEKV